MANQRFRYETEVSSQITVISSLIARPVGRFGEEQPPSVIQYTRSNEPREGGITEPLIRTLAKKQNASGELVEQSDVTHPSQAGTSHNDTSHNDPLQVDENANSIPRRKLLTAGSVDL